MFYVGGNVEQIALLCQFGAIAPLWGLDRVEALQSHDNVEIYHKSLAILEQYFSTEVIWFLTFVF